MAGCAGGARRGIRSLRTSLRARRPCRIREAVGIPRAEAEEDLFVGGERADLCFEKVSQFEISDGDAHQTQDLKSQGLQHSPNLTVLPLLEDDLEPGIFVARPQPGGAQSGEPVAVRGANTLHETIEEVIRSVAADLDVVGLVEVAQRGEDLGRPLRVMVRRRRPSLALSRRPTGAIQGSPWGSRE